MTYEFRDRTNDGSVYGFVPPPSEIKPNADEVLQSLIGLTQEAAKLGYLGGLNTEQFVASCAVESELMKLKRNSFSYIFKNKLGSAYRGAWLMAGIWAIRAHF